MFAFQGDVMARGPFYSSHALRPGGQLPSVRWKCRSGRVGSLAFLQAHSLGWGSARPAV